MKTNNHTHSCRFCNTTLNHQFVDLHHAPASNDYLGFGALNQAEVYYPLEVFVCTNCLLVQVPEYKSYDQLFSDDYAYFSSYSTSWVAHAKAFSENIVKDLNLKPGTHRIMEVASNDGYLLQFFHQQGFEVVGVEPTLSTAEVARSKGIETITSFFGVSLAQEIVKNKDGFDLICGNNVLAHVPDLNDFVKGLRLALSTNGTITLEFPHLLQLILNHQFDTIYHEHFSYFSLHVLLQVFSSNELEIFRVEEIPTHGGSLRLYVGHVGSRSINPSVQLVLSKEKQANLDVIEGYDNFQRICEKIKFDFLDFLIARKRENQRIVAYGAAAKGNTLLNYCGIKSDLISYVIDANPHKQGKFLPGSHIPIYDEARLKRDKPDYIIIFPWNIKDEIIQQLNYCREWDAQFVIAIPELSII